LTLGAESNGVHSWDGKIRLLAIHNVALTEEQIQQNFDAGVGQKFNMLFKIGHLDDAGANSLPDSSYIWFTVSEFDNFSYLFSDPRFVILNQVAGDPLYTIGTDETTLTTPVDISGIKIGINGREVEVGQVFENINTSITKSPQSLVGTKSYDFGDGNGTVSVPAAASGTIIAKKNGASGPSADQFFLSFEHFAGQTGLVTDSTSFPLTYDYPGTDADPDYIVGVRNFDELNATMAQVTGVDPASVETSFENLKQQLPSKENLQGFLASMQMAIANLAGIYCDALVEDPTLRTNFFGSFGFTSNVDTAFGSGDSTQKNQIVNALVTKMVGTGLNIQPDTAAIKDALIGSDGNGGLFGSLETTCAADGCTRDAARTRTIVKGMCMAVLGSAAVTQQ